jgi:predicted enzyme related to lactoylglutathione lyase
MAGELVHFEVRAGDMARAQRFWGSLLGWKFRQSDVPVPYALLETGKDPAGGLYETESPERGLLVYFSVDDIDSALVRVRELGGVVDQERTPVPEVGWFARCRDTEGNEFSLFESAPAAPAR